MKREPKSLQCSIIRINALVSFSINPLEEYDTGFAVSDI